MEHAIRRCVPAVLICTGASDQKEYQNLCARKFDADETWRASREIRSGRRLRRHSFRGYGRVLSVVDSSRSLARSQRNLDEFGAVHIPRIHLARPILIKDPTGSYRHRCVDGCCSETQDWDRKNVQQYCQPRTETQASAKYPRCCDHSRAMLTWPCMIDVERV